MTCGILVLWPGIEPRSSPGRVRSPNEWPTKGRKVLMWFPDRCHCVRSSLPHSSRQPWVLPWWLQYLEPEPPRLWPFRKRGGAIPSLWCFCSLMVSCSWACLPSPERASASCWLCKCPETAQARLSAEAEQTHLKPHVWHTKTRSGFLCTFPQLVQHWSTYFSIW